MPLIFFTSQKTECPGSNNDPGHPLKMEMVYINAFRPINTNAIYLKWDLLFRQIAHITDGIDGNKCLGIDFADVVH